MARPFTRAQTLQNAAFLRELRRTGNARDAARTLGLHRATLTRRRNTHPAFAADWDAALAIAHAALKVLPELCSGRGTTRSVVEGPAAKRRVDASSHEPRIMKTASGRLQLRRAQPGRLTPAAEQAFLSALGATCNVRLSAAAAGFSHSAFYYRARTNPGFAREMRLALETGHERLELALLESTLPDAHADDAWRHNDPPAIPPMTADQAIQLLHLHNKTVHLQAEPAHIRRRSGETGDAWSFRLAAMAEANRRRAREDYAVAEAERRARGEPSPFEPLPPSLPDLAQVTGWSKAKPHADSGAIRETAPARPTGSPQSTTLRGAPASAEPTIDDACPERLPQADSRRADFARGGAGEGVPDCYPTGFARESEAELDQVRTRNGFVRERKPGVALFGGWRVKGRGRSS